MLMFWWSVNGDGNIYKSNKTSIHDELDIIFNSVTYIGNSPFLDITARTDQHNIIIDVNTTAPTPYANESCLDHVNDVFIVCEDWC